MHDDRDHVDDTSDVDPTHWVAQARPESSVAPPRDDPQRSAARAFLDEARESDDEVAPPPRVKGRGRPWFIVVASVVVAAQILALGVYSALRILQPDETTESVEAAVPTPEPTAFPTPTPQPSVEPTATPLPTPTAIPPTPSWIPEQDGPRTSPFTFIATTNTSLPAFFAEPNGEEIPPDPELEAQIGASSRVHFRVLSGEPSGDWARVALPGDAASSAWIRSTDVEWSSTNRLVRVDVTTNTLQLFEGNDVVFEAAVATGSRSSPTPPMQSWIIDNQVGDEVPDAQPFLLAAPSGGTTLVIAPASDSSIIGDYATGGDVLLGDDEARRLARLIPAGAKVEVVGAPVVPTPTPLPTPTPIEFDDLPTAPQVTERVGCPPGTLGQPPECYRIAQRTRVTGECPPGQLVRNGQCALFRGDKELTDQGGFTCPPEAPTEIDDRCYRLVGPVPTAPGPCPPEATEVGDECRIPVGS